MPHDPFKAYDLEFDALTDEPRRVPAPEPRANARPPRAGQWSSRALLALVLITLLAGLLRLYKIGEWSFWVDEVHTLRDSVLTAPGTFWSENERRMYPLGFLLVQLLAPILPGAGEGSFRLIFAFFGIASVPLMAIAFRPILGAAPAILSSLILTLSPWHIYWSQNCRVYALVLFLVLAATGCFHLGVERAKRSWLFAALALAALAGAGHPIGLLVLPAFVLHVVALRYGIGAVRRKLPRRIVVPFLLILGVGLAAAMWPAIRIIAIYMRAKPSASFGHLVNTTVFFVRIPVIVAAIGGFLMLFRRRSRGGLLLGLLIAVPALELALASVFVKVTAQYQFYTLPAWCALAGYGVWEATKGLRLKGYSRRVVRMLPLAMLVLDLGAQDYLYYRVRHGDRPRWREAADFVDARAGGADRIASTNQPCMEWYLNPTRPVVDPRPGLDAQRTVDILARWTLPKLPAWCAEADEKGTSVWLVLSEPEFREMDADAGGSSRGEWERWVRERFHQLARFTAWNGPKDMVLFVYRYTPVAGGAAPDGR